MAVDAGNGQPPANQGDDTSVNPGGDPPKAAGAKTTASSGDGIAAGHNIWDFLTVAVVMVAFVGLTVFLVISYTKVSNVSTVLGIAAPVFAAVFGVSLGYATGSKSGKVTGKAQGKQEAKDMLMPKISDVAKSSGELVDTLRLRGTSPNGSRSLLLQDDQAEPVTFTEQNLELKSQVARLQSTIEGL